MYIIKNAFRNIFRSFGRNVLIGIIALVIVVASCIALSIKQASKTAEADGIKKITITATIGVDRTKIQSQAGNDRTALMTLMQKYPSLTLDDMQKYSASKNVKAFNYTAQSSFTKSTDFEPYSETAAATATTATTTTTTTKTTVPKADINAGKGFGGMGKQGDFSVSGYSSEGSMTSFADGSNKITSGEIFSFGSADYTCIISETLATFNNLKVGDTITLVNPNLSTETYTLTIKGIYSIADTTSQTGMRFSTSQDPINHIFTNYSTLESITNNSTTNAQTGTDAEGIATTTALRNQVSGVYTFASTQAFDNFKTDLVSMGLPEFYTATSTDLTNYEQSLVPLNNLSKFANVFLILVLSIGGVILVVLNIFNIRERKYEVGVLTAIGMKKGKVALQFVIELFLVTFAAIIIGASVGAVASVPTANSMLASQVASAKVQQDTQNNNFGRQGNGANFGNNPMGQIPRNSSKNYIDNISASTDMSIVVQLVGIGVLLTLISSLGAVVFILRYEPLKILSNRN